MTNDESRKISLCLTTYNRSDLTARAFSQVLNHPNIDEVVIIDDNSELSHYTQLRYVLSKLGSSKVKLYRNSVNLDCYQNKKRAVELATNDWVILLDSDNVIDNNFIDVLLRHNWHQNTILAPCSARPHFDYKGFCGIHITKAVFPNIMNMKSFDALINTCNYFFNKREYLRIHKSDINPHAADTCYFNYCWIEAGNCLFICDGLEYQHDVHDKSHYKENNHKSNGLFDELMEKFRDINLLSETPPFISDFQKGMEEYKKNGIHSFIPDVETPNVSVVTFKPMGRLGNFFFEAATAYAYALKHGLSFSPPSTTNDTKWNPIYLEHLTLIGGVTEPTVTIKEKTYFKYEELEFKEEWKYGQVIELDGYFQNPKYFKEYEDEILTAFNIMENYYPEAVSIHIRRGDYLIHTDKHIPFSDQYMIDAMDIFKKQGLNQFMVFSDDIPWCRSYFSDIKFNWAQINFSEGTTELQDLKEMSAYKGHINSSSTFSWWGAWAGANHATVVTPKEWMLHAHSNEWTLEILPENWIKL